MSLGQLLCEARKKAGYTQEVLAKKVGIAKSTLAGYEKDNREPNFLTLNKFCKELGVNLNYFGEEESEAQTKSPATLADDEAERLALDTEIMRVFSELPEDRQRLALDVIARILEAFAEN